MTMWHTKECEVCDSRFKLERDKVKSLSIKRVHRLIAEERKSSLVRYLKKFLRTSSAEKHKTEIEEYTGKLVADENYPEKKEVLKRLEKWNT